MLKLYYILAILHDSPVTAYFPQLCPSIMSVRETRILYILATADQYGVPSLLNSLCVCVSFHIYPVGSVKPDRHRRMFRFSANITLDAL